MDSNWNIINNQSWDTNDPDVINNNAQLDEETSEFNIETFPMESSTSPGANPSTNFRLYDGWSSYLDTSLSRILNERPFVPPWQSFDDFSARVSIFRQMLRKVEQERSDLSYGEQLSLATGHEARHYLQADTREIYLDISTFLGSPLPTLSANDGMIPDNNPLHSPLIVTEAPTKNDLLIDGPSRTMNAYCDYRNLIAIHERRYSRATIIDKEAMIDYIISQIHRKPGRFLQYYVESQEFYIQLWPLEEIRKVELDLMASHRPIASRNR